MTENNSVDALAKTNVQKASKWNQWSRSSDSLGAHWHGAAEKGKKKHPLGEKSNKLFLPMGKLHSSWIRQIEESVCCCPEGDVMTQDMTCHRESPAE